MNWVLKVTGGKQISIQFLIKNRVDVSRLLTSPHVNATFLYISQYKRKNTHNCVFHYISFRDKPHTHIQKKLVKNANLRQDPHGQNHHFGG